MLSKNSQKFNIWQKRIKAWKKSGLSQKEYCLREKITYATFNYWKRQVEPKTKTSQNLKSSLINAGNFHLMNICQIVTPSGYQLKFPENISCEKIENILKVIRVTS